MFLATRRRLALWYTIVTAILLLLFATGFYLYVRTTLIERIDDTLNHVVEVVQRSLVIEPINFHQEGGGLKINVEASFRNNPADMEDDHIDLEWFSPDRELLWSTFSEPLPIPLHTNSNGETVKILDESTATGSCVLRQVTHKVQIRQQLLGYLRVSHPWFEVTKPIRQLGLDLSLGIGLMVLGAGAIGWLLSGLAMEPMQASYQRLKQFTADASHELRNPIATIQTNVQVALSDPEPDLQFQHRQLQVVERLTRRLGHLVDDLLFLARQDSGMVEPTMTAIDLPALLQDVVEEQQLNAEEKQITLTLSLQLLADQPSGLKTWGDRHQLARLFTNLVINALQFTPIAGQVTVEIQHLDRPEPTEVKSSLPSFPKSINRPKPPYLQIKVTDTGIGIPPEALPHLFDRFYRVDPARTRETSPMNRTIAGSGLGLAIAWTIVQTHQGQLFVESQPQQGSTFTVLLPVYEGDA